MWIPAASFCAKWRVTLSCTHGDSSGCCRRPDNQEMSRSTLEPAAPSARVDIIDPLVVNPGRLCILIALAESEGETDAPLAFTHLRRRRRLSDGNLSCHAQRLATGSLIGIAKQFRDGKPSTTYLLTP